MKVRRSWVTFAAAVLLALPLAAQSPPQDRADADAVARFKDEGLQRSKVMETASYLTDVYGPRLTGSSNLRRAQAWAQERLKKYGMENIHLEGYEFGRGWELKRFAAHMLQPSYAPLIARSANQRSYLVLLPSRG